MAKGCSKCLLLFSSHVFSSDIWERVDLWLKICSWNLWNFVSFMSSPILEFWLYADILRIFVAVLELPFDGGSDVHGSFSFWTSAPLRSCGLSHAWILSEITKAALGWNIFSSSLWPGDCFLPAIFWYWKLSSHWGLSDFDDMPLDLLLYAFPCN